MKNNCPNIKNELSFFQGLMLNILTNRIVYKKFEEKMKQTNITIYNDFMWLSWYGYTISQLSDCRKFFDRDGDVYSFSFLVKHTSNTKIKNKHKELFKIWKNEKLENVINQYLLHANKAVDKEDKLNISPNILDAFIDKLDIYTKEIANDISSNYLGISVLNYDGGYLEERENEVEIFFEQVKKIK